MSQKIKVGLIGLLIVAVAALGGWVLLFGGDDDAKPLGARQSQPSDSPSASASPSPTGTPSPTASASQDCEGPDTLFNVEGVKQESLLPDCGAAVVTRDQQKKSGLDLGCGGSYPVILYKTTTDSSKASVCGRDASGEKFRVVIKPTGAKTLDLPGEYDGGNDSFIGTQGKTKYEIVGRTGDIYITGPDGKRFWDSDDDFISLDNESDYD